jgi:iron complex outermembrane receptor protein
MGLEFDGRLELLDKKIKPFVNWTLQKSAFKGGIYTGSQVPFVPKNKLSSGLTLLPIKGLDWTTTLYYMGSRYKISDQKNIAPKLKDYATVDTTLSYKYKYVEVWGALKNIFNKKYYDYGVTNSTGTSETFYPAQGRSAEAGMTVKF